MLFSLMGDDPAVLTLVQAVLDSERHSLVSAALVGELAEPLLQRSPSLRRVEGWEDVLANSSVEALIVCGSRTSVLEGTRQIASSGIPILLLPHADQGAEFAYELMLVRDDTGTCLVPAFLASQHACVRQLSRAISNGDLGKVRFMRFDRIVPTETGALTNRQLDSELLHDADLLRSLVQVAGRRDAEQTADENRIDIDQVTGLASGVTDEGLLTATVTLAGAHVPESTWSVNSVSPSSHADEHRQSWTLIAKGDDRTATLSGFNRHDEVQLAFEPEIAHAPELAHEADAVRPGPGSDRKVDMLDMLDRFELETKRVRESSGADSSRSERERADIEDVLPAWNDLTRAFEILDARHRSIRRRRTIDLYFETTSERNQFKTQMTALGCGVMSLTFFGLLAYLVIASLVDLPEGVLQVARVVWLIPLMAFITLQLLYFITRPSAND